MQQQLPFGTGRNTNNHLSLNEQIALLEEETETSVAASTSRKRPKNIAIQKKKEKKMIPLPVNGSYRSQASKVNLLKELQHQNAAMKIKMPSLRERNGDLSIEMFPN